MKARFQAGWIDYLIAFLSPYVVLMLLVGGNAFHLEFILERTLYSARYHITFLGFGILYFSIAEGLWGAGLGKRFKGLRVTRPNGHRPGIGRAVLRILIPILLIEGVRIPFLMASIHATRINDLTATHSILYIAATSLCPMIPIMLALLARRKNGFTTLWDSLSKTRVVIRPEGTWRPLIGPITQPMVPAEGARALGPFQFIEEVVPGAWISATDPVLRRPVWLLRRTASEPSASRRNIARPGRLRWLQAVETTEETWDAFEAVQGVPFARLIEAGQRVRWVTMRHWLHDLASELWAATGDQTLPATLGLDQVWITTQGHAVLLDEAWPRGKTPSERFPVGDLAGQQRFLSAVAAGVEYTSLPLHARPVLQNLEEGKFEKLSFLTGILRGLLDKPAEVTKGLRAVSIYLFPLYVWIMLFVGFYHAEGRIVAALGDATTWLAMNTALLVLTATALIQLLELPFRTTVSHATFRLAVVDARGERAGRARLFIRWMIVWLPLFIPLSLLALLFEGARGTEALIAVLAVLFLWAGTTTWVLLHSNRGLHDRLADTWVVRR